MPPTNSSWPTRTSSYIAAPIMFSAITTGPDTPKTWPNRLSRSSSLIFGSCFLAFCSAPAMLGEYSGCPLQSTQGTLLGIRRHMARDKRRVMDFCGSLSMSLAIPSHPFLPTTIKYATEIVSFQDICLNNPMLIDLCLVQRLGEMWVTWILFEAPKLNPTN